MEKKVFDCVSLMNFNRIVSQKERQIRVAFYDTVPDGYQNISILHMSEYFCARLSKFDVPSVRVVVNEMDCDNSEESSRPNVVF